MKRLKSTICGAMCVGLLLSSAPFLGAAEPTLATEPKVEEANLEIHSTIQDLESLFVLMQERLSVMHDIARYKWNHSLQDQTLDRESLDAQPLSYENNEYASEIIDFLNAQNRAAEKIQEQDFMLFKSEGVEKFENVKDYQTEISPKLEELNTQMVLCIKELLVHTQNGTLPNFLKDVSFNSFKNEGVERNVYDIAVEPLFDN